MRMWNQTILATAKGKTAGTYDSIGSITIRKGAKYILGFYELIVNTKPTADEASSPVIKILSNDLGINYTLPSATIGAEGMAAHQGGVVRKTFHMWSPEGDVEHAIIDFEVTSIIACSEGFDCAIQLVTSDEKPDERVYAQLLAQHMGEWTGVNHGIEAAGAGNSATLAAWGSTNADQPRISASASSIRGISYTINANAETASVPLCNYAELTCTAISDFPPQQHIVQAGISGALGTVINSITETSVPPEPFIFDGLPQAQCNVDVSDINSLTGFTAGDGKLGLFWK